MAFVWLLPKRRNHYFKFLELKQGDTEHAIVEIGGTFEFIRMGDTLVGTCPAVFVSYVEQVPWITGTTGNK